MADKKEKLFSDFSPVSTEQWMEKVTADLKGADFEKKLDANLLNLPVSDFMERGLPVSGSYTGTRI